MKRAFFILLLLFILVSGYAQNDRNYHPIEFEGYQTKWTHPVVDSSLIGKIKSITSEGDTIYYDGFSLFFSIDPFNVNPVIYKDNLYIIEQLWKGLGPSGTYIECIDINTGKSKWQTRFYNEGGKKELTRYAFINDEQQLELIGEKEFKAKRYHLIKRKYDLDSGELIEKILVSNSNQEAYVLYPVSLFPGGTGVYSFYLFPDKIGKVDEIYFYRNLIITTLNDSCKVESIDSINIENDFDFALDLKLRRTEDGNYLFFLFSGNQALPTQDSFGYYFNFFDNEFNLIASRNLQKIIKPIRYSLHFKDVYYDDDYFIIRGIDSVRNQDNSSILDMATYSLFDTEGNLIEEISVTDGDGNPFDYGYKNNIFGIATKLKYEKGMLIVFASEDKQKNRYLNFVKSDGIGNAVFNKQFKLKDNSHLPLIRDVFQLSNGDIVLSYFDSVDSLMQSGYNSSAIAYSVFPAKDLNIMTSTVKEFTTNGNITLYPNPTKSKLKIFSTKEKFDNYVIFDAAGNKVYTKYFESTNELKINIQNLKTGVYFINIYNHKTQISALKFIKD